MSGCKTHQLRAAVVKAAQVEGAGQDPRWDPLPPSPLRGPLGEMQGHLWVPSDTAELENYAGYIVSCSTQEAKFTHLFNEITTHHIKSVTCTMNDWWYKDSNFTQQSSPDNSGG